MVTLNDLSRTVCIREAVDWPNRIYIWIPVINTYSRVEQLDPVFLRQGERFDHQNEVEHDRLEGTVYRHGIPSQSISNMADPNSVALNSYFRSSTSNTFDVYLQIENFRDYPTEIHVQIKTHMSKGDYWLATARQFEERNGVLYHRPLNNPSGYQVKDDLATADQHSYSQWLNALQDYPFVPGNWVKTSYTHKTVNYNPLPPVQYKLGKYWRNYCNYFNPAYLDKRIDEEFGDLSLKIADDVRPYKTNIYANILQLDDQNPLKSLASALDDVGNASALAADVLFESQYGYNLTARDNMALYNALFTAASTNRVYRASTTFEVEGDRTTCNVQLWLTAKVKREDSRVISAINDAYSIGVMPTLANTWDLVPFSFVLDWFLPISESLRQLDAPGELASLPISYSLLTKKIEYQLPNVALVALFGQGCSGSVSRIRYHRHILHNAVPPVHPHFDGLQKPHVNYVAATALLCQINGGRA